MMTHSILHVLCPDGDVKLTWDPNDPEEVAKARAEVLALKAAGFSFFLIDGSPAPDEVSHGQGALSCRRVEAEALLPPVPPVYGPPTIPGVPPVMDDAVPAAPRPLAERIKAKPGSATAVLAAAVEARGLDLTQQLDEETLGALAAECGLKPITVKGYLSTMRVTLGIDGRSRRHGTGETFSAPAAAEPVQAVATRPLRGG